jgi:hypothetical protein
MLSRPVSADLPAHKDLRTTPTGRGTRRDWFNLKLQSREDCRLTVSSVSVNNTRSKAGVESNEFLGASGSILLARFVVNDYVYSFIS